MNIAASSLMSLAAAALVGLLVGFLVGSRRSRRSRRELQRTLGVRELELLEARAARSRLAKHIADRPRRERLLRLALSRLREVQALERRRFVEVARLRLQAAESGARARRAARLARRAARRVSELEAAVGATGTITTHAAKSYGNGEPVTVSVVDHETPEARLDGVTRMPHRERARLARLAPSNEERQGRALGELSVIRGLAAADEHRLNALGIHRLEQLASLTEHEQRTLDELIENSAGGRPLSAWIGDARALLESSSSP